MTDKRKKPTAESARVEPIAALERELGILFKVPPAELAAAESVRIKKRPRSTSKG